MSSNSLTILRQDSLAKEKFSKNEIQKEVHVVAKNLPFVIDVGNSDGMQFSTARISAKLFYDADYDNEFKQVDYVKQIPMTYKSFVSTSGDRATIEIRLLVLTSQHEDSLFRVKILVTSQQDQTYEVISEPIRVVSKPSQVHKKRRTGASTVEITAPSTPAACGTKRSAPSSSSSSSPNTSNQESVLETLQRMQEQQLEQRKLIEQLLLQQTLSSSSKITSSSSSSFYTDDGDFNSAFQAFINAYNRVPIEERPNKLRKAMLSNPTASDSVADFVTVCASPEHNLLGDSAMKSITSIFGCNGECEHKKQLETFGDLYTELTWSPESSEL